MDFANSSSSVCPLTQIFDTSLIQYGIPIVPSFTIVKDVVAVAPEYCNSSSYVPSFHIILSNANGAIILDSSCAIGIDNN